MPWTAWIVRAISKAPGMKTSMSPPVSAATRSHSRAATSHTGSESKFTGLARYSIWTGKVRPWDSRTSQGFR